MQIITSKAVMPADRCDVIMKTFFGRDALKNQKLTMGTVVFPPGARVPAQGAGVHDEHEYSYIISGSILTMSGGQEYRISEGQATLIPAGEEHWAYNDGTENCEIIWVLTKP
ncbi:cupin domain-containing protein [Desulfosporosinus orientis DSM 765]|uniref:Cupin domain-containing protein n=1 Tax=Desulfosporosinus orientis (strain ATCC 19365 / DSM 765 / NCIMB 8382 / VKM B-1628 / Singapore I) TaxID=768706 RepID=G7WE15_DESOD|nr:cupin domain-containing protein [Desulfosporosinus orientis]AET69413.1 cupin domain-containing protein [Desulfosporosinus orientis DSM 765]